MLKGGAHRAHAAAGLRVLDVEEVRQVSCATTAVSYGAVKSKPALWLIRTATGGALPTDPIMAEDRRQAKQAVLDRVNTALVLAGLNDTVWSIRDCDSTLFVLMYKKLVGKVRHTCW